MQFDIGVTCQHGWAKRKSCANITVEPLPFAAALHLQNHAFHLCAITAELCCPRSRSCFSRNRFSQLDGVASFCISCIWWVAYVSHRRTEKAKWKCESRRMGAHIHSQARGSCNMVYIVYIVYALNLRCVLVHGILLRWPTFKSNSILGSIFQLAAVASLLCYYYTWLSSAPFPLPLLRIILIIPFYESSAIQYQFNIFGQLGFTTISNWYGKGGSWHLVIFNVPLTKVMPYMCELNETKD